MEIFQEPTFTAFVALILSFVVAKIVSFAVCCSGTDCDPVVCCVDEGAVAKEGALSKELRVGKAKGKKKRVKFVVDDDGDAIVRRVGCYQGFENRVLLDDADDSVGKVIGNSSERVDELGLNELNEDSGRELDEEKKDGESDGDNMDEGFSGKGKNSLPGDRDGVIVEEQKNEVGLEGDAIISDQKEEGEGMVGCGANEEAKTDRVIVDDEDDDWEGIERSELEKVFAEAVNYVEYGGKGKLGSDVQMQLYGLHKVAVEGHCHDSQPMALKLLARAKWNAWQRLGSITREAAMEQYIRLLSDTIPAWINDHSAVDDIHGSPVGGNVSVPENERELELGAPPHSAGDSGTEIPVQKVTIDKT